MTSNGRRGNDSDAPEPRQAPSVINPSPPPVPFLSLFRFATTKERAVLTVAAIASMINGATMPGFSILLGKLLNNLNTSGFLSTIYLICLALFLLGVAAFVLSLAEMALFNVVATRIIRRIRVRCLKGVQNVREGESEGVV